VVGATNHPDRIDPALRRAGRLDRHVAIGLPDLDDRRELARLYCGGALTENDLDRVAAATTGFTGADFERVGRDARRSARRAGRAATIEDVFGSLPPARRIVGGERRMVAIHEAAHAVVGHRLGVGHLQTVAVPWEVREPQSLGYAFFEMDEHQLWERQGLLDRIAMTLAGRAAEEEIIGTAFDGAGAAEGADLHVASDVATMIEVRLGMGEGLAFYNLQTVEERDRVRQNNPQVAARVERLLHQEMDRSRAIVRDFRHAIEKIADVLVRQAVVEGEEVRRILRENKP
jgi:ATP-dependent Zn protease